MKRSCIAAPALLVGLGSFLFQSCVSYGNNPSKEAANISSDSSLGEPISSESPPFRQSTGLFTHVFEQRVIPDTTFSRPDFFWDLLSPDTSEQKVTKYSKSLVDQWNNQASYFEAPAGSIPDPVRLSARRVRLDNGELVILITFPTPKLPGESYYAAILFDYKDTLRYITYEKPQEDQVLQGQSPRAALYEWTQDQERINYDLRGPATENFFRNLLNDIVFGSPIPPLDSSDSALTEDIPPMYYDLPTAYGYTNFYDYLWYDSWNDPWYFSYGYYWYERHPFYYPFGWFYIHYHYRPHYRVPYVNPMPPPRYPHVRPPMRPGTQSPHNVRPPSGPRNPRMDSSGERPRSPRYENPRTGSPQNLGQRPQRRPSSETRSSQLSPSTSSERPRPPPRQQVDRSERTARDRDSSSRATPPPRSRPSSEQGSRSSPRAERPSHSSSSRNSARSSERPQRDSSNKSSQNARPSRNSSESRGSSRPPPPPRQESSPKANQDSSSQKQDK